MTQDQFHSDGTQVVAGYWSDAVQISGAQGPTGPNGVRGSVTVVGTVTSDSWSDTAAATAVAAITSGDTPKTGDICTLVYGTYSESRVFETGTGWVSLSAYIGSSQIVSSAITDTFVAFDYTGVLDSFSNVT
jgi:hypothetical protein